MNMHLGHSCLPVSRLLAPSNFQLRHLRKYGSEEWEENWENQDMAWILWFRRLVPPRLDQGPLALRAKRNAYFPRMTRRGRKKLFTGKVETNQELDETF